MCRSKNLALSVPLASKSGTCSPQWGSSFKRKHRPTSLTAVLSETWEHLTGLHSKAISFVLHSIAIPGVQPSNAVTLMTSGSHHPEARHIAERRASRRADCISKDVLIVRPKQVGNGLKRAANGLPWASGNEGRWSTRLCPAGERVLADCCVRRGPSPVFGRRNASVSSAAHPGPLWHSNSFYFSVLAPSFMSTFHPGNVQTYSVKHRTRAIRIPIR
jgi:hypothetical protein